MHSRRADRQPSGKHQLLQSRTAFHRGKALVLPHFPMAVNTLKAFFIVGIHGSNIGPPAMALPIQGKQEDLHCIPTSRFRCRRSP